MSRIGRKPITVPSGVEIKIEPELVTVKGPKGELSERISRDMTVQQDGETLTVERPTDRGEHRALHGLTRSLVANMVEGAVGRLGKIKVAYVHAAAQEETEKIRELIEGRLTCVESLVSELSPALGVHTGPGTVGLCYYPVKK